MQRGFAIIYLLIGIVILVSVGGGAYYFNKFQNTKLQLQQNYIVPSPTPKVTQVKPSTPAINEIDKWKTYKNDKYSFKLKYPEQFSIEKMEPVIDGNLPRVVADLDLQINQNDGNSLLIRITSIEILKKNGDNFPVFSTEQWLAEKSLVADGDMGSDCSFLLASKFDSRQNECEIIKMNGIKMLDRIMFWPPGAATGRSFTFYNNNLRYDFIIFSDLINQNSNKLLSIKESNDLMGIKLYLQILSTFKFTQ